MSWLRHVSIQQGGVYQSDDIEYSVNNVIHIRFSKQDNKPTLHVHSTSTSD